MYTKAITYITQHGTCYYLSSTLQNKSIATIRPNVCEHDITLYVIVKMTS